MLITPAYAQAAAGGDANSMLMSLLPFALIFVIMYFLILRPQQKKVKDHAELGQKHPPRRHRRHLGRPGRQGHQGGRRRPDRVRDFRRRPRAADAADDFGRPRQGRAGQGKGRRQGRDVRELSFRSARHFPDLTGQLDVVFHAVEGAGDHSDGAGGVPVRRSEFLPEARVKTWPVWAQRHIVLGLDLQGGSYLLLEVDSNYVKKEKLDQVRDDVRRVLREAKIGYTGLYPRATDAVEVRITKETDVPDGATQAA